MAKKNDNGNLENMLLQFITEPDPLFSLLKWLPEKLMEIEAANKVRAKKGSHSTGRTTHFLRIRPRRFDTRLGTLYLLVPKLRKGGYIPFFVTEKKRSGQALIQAVQEAFINPSGGGHSGKTKRGSDSGSSRSVHQRGFDQED